MTITTMTKEKVVVTRESYTGMDICFHPSPQNLFPSPTVPSDIHPMHVAAKTQHFLINVMLLCSRN